MKRLQAAILCLAGLLAGTAQAHDTVYYYSSDTLHSEVVITDANRNVVERTYYAPYGQVLNRALRDGPGYTGHEEDPGTGLVYMQQRYYDPQSGRFLSVDPVATTGDGANLNHYWYANDNPYRYTDPDGRAPKLDQQRLSCTGSNIGGGACGALHLSIAQVGSRSVSEQKAAAARQAASHGGSLPSGQIKAAQKEAYEGLIKKGAAIQMAGGLSIIGGHTLQFAGGVVGAGEDVLGGGPEDPAADAAGVATFKAASAAATAYLIKPGERLMLTGGAMSAAGAAGLMNMGYPRAAINTAIESYPDQLTGSLAPFVDSKLIEPALNRVEDTIGVPSDKQ